MEIKDITEENQISIKTVATEHCDSTETRSYNLKEQRALKKKLDATDRDDVQITSTGGGVKICLNTGAYELLKSSAEQFYSGKNNQFRFQTTPVVDKRGNNVETKYKVTCGKSPVYTFNMYHTKSSCLVNGKSVQQFMDHDFPQMIQDIENRLSAENTSIEDVNFHFKNILSQYRKDHAQEEMSADTHTVSAPKPLLSQLSAENNHSLVSENTTYTVSHANATDRTDSDSHYDKYINLLESISESVTLLHATLESHIKVTDRNFGQIRDEIQSVKRQVQVENEHNTTLLDEIGTETNNLKQLVMKNYDTLTRRLQQITDLVKHMPAKSQTTSSDQTPVVETEPAQSASSVHSKAPERERTLLIGDSILKGIQPPGLAKHVDLIKTGGAKINDISEKLHELDVRRYSDVIIHVGGNDVSDGKLNDTSYRELSDVTQKLQSQHCKVHLCTVCPRQDTDVNPLNDGIRQLCREAGADLVDCYQAFINGNGEAVRPYFTSDGIHLSMYGSRTLVATINKNVPITSKRNIVKQTISQNTIHAHNSQYQTRRRRTNMSWQMRGNDKPVRTTFGQQRGVRQFCHICKMNNHHTNECWFNR